MNDGSQTRNARWSGLGKFKDQIKASDRHIGSIPWTAPEVLAEQPAVDYMLADIFSFGVVLFEIATRRNPYEHLRCVCVCVCVIVLQANAGNTIARLRSPWVCCGTTCDRRRTSTRTS